jgi:hypothetical protein
MGKSVLTNRARHLVTVPLNSGETIHLAPGESTPAIDDREFDHNRDVARLLADRLLATRSEEEEAESGKGRRKPGRS